jgi:hypothetical protein
MKRPVKFVLWTNGMIMAIDADGNQVPEWQGEGRKLIPRIRREFPDLVIEGRDWRTDMLERIGK